MALTGNALTTEAAVQQILGTGFATARVEQAINAVTDLFERYCDRQFAYGSYTAEEAAGRGRWKILVKNYPIIAVSAVTVDTTAITDYTVTDEAAEGMIWRDTGWPGSWAPHYDLTRDADRTSSKANVAVTYTAGYFTPQWDGVTDATWNPAGAARDLPYDLEQAAIDLVVARLVRPVATIRQERTPGGHAITVSEDAAGFPSSIRAVLDSYRRAVAV